MGARFLTFLYWLVGLMFPVNVFGVSDTPTWIFGGCLCWQALVLFTIHMVIHQQISCFPTSKIIRTSFLCSMIVIKVYKRFNFFNEKRVFNVFGLSREGCLKYKGRSSPPTSHATSPSRQMEHYMQARYWYGRCVVCRVFVDHCVCTLFITLLYFRCWKGAAHM